MNLDASISTPIRDAQKALSLAARIVATVPATPSARLHALQKMADHLRQYVRGGWLNPATVADKIFEVAELHGLSGKPGSDKEAAIMQIAMSANLPAELRSTGRHDGKSDDAGMPTAPPLETKTPADWGDRAAQTALVGGSAYSLRGSHALFRQWWCRKDGDSGAAAGLGDRWVR